MLSDSCFVGRALQLRSILYVQPVIISMEEVEKGYRLNLSSKAGIVVTEEQAWSLLNGHCVLGYYLMGIGEGNGE